MEDYKKKYENALNAGRKFKNDCPLFWDTKSNPFKYVFEELEDEDEKIRKELLKIAKESEDSFYMVMTPRKRESLISWLEKQGERSHCNGEVNDEALQRQLQIWFDKGKCSGRDEVIFHPENFGLQKQGEQKPFDYENANIQQKDFASKVEPKFKVGDWVIYNRNDSSREIIQVYDIRDGRYYFTDNVHFSWSIKECDEKAHLWTIQDAKDGDVLTWDDSKCIALFKEIYNKHSFKSHGCIGACTAVFENWGFHYIENAHPSTKEQRDLLFQKMKEAGYEWDTEKKELKKIEQNSTSEIGNYDHKKVLQTIINEQNPAWSEEDEEMVECLNNCLDELEEKNGWVYVYVNNKDVKLCEVRNWLKSLRPQNAWLPSDEQIEALESATKNCTYSEYQDCLRELIEQLKKLREE